MSSVASGEKTLPSAARLTREVFAHLFLPLIEKSLTASFGFFGRPVAWAYRRSQGRLVLFAIKLIPDRDDSPGSSTEISKSMESIAKNEPVITSRLQWTRDKLTYASSRIRFIMLVPYASIALATLAITIWMSIWMWRLTAG